MKENYKINLTSHFRPRVQSFDREPQLSYKKMNTMFLWKISKSRKLTSTFFPTIGRPYGFCQLGSLLDAIIYQNICLSFCLSIHLPTHLSVLFVANANQMESQKHAWAADEVQSRYHKKTRLDVWLPRSLVGGQGLYLKSLEHLGRSSKAND